MSSISRPHKARLGHVHYNSDSEVSGRGCWVVRKLDANSAMCSWVGLLYTFTGLALASKFTISSKSKEAEGSWLVQLPPVLEKYLEKYLTSPVLKHQFCLSAIVHVSSQSLCLSLVSVCLQVSWELCQEACV